jgi:hypothetical protein
MRFKVRKANIPPYLRDELEALGEQVMALAMGLGVMKGGGLGTAPEMPTLAMMLAYQNNEQIKAWLQEKRDQAEYRETRLEIVEWAILIFLIVSVYLELRGPKG